jgi:alanine racemase
VANKKTVNSFKGSPGELELLAIVKADAYGHGLRLCAPAALRAGARWLGVTSVEEGVIARELCPSAEILVVSGPFSKQGEAVVAHDLISVVWDPWQLDELEQAARDAGTDARRLRVHLEVDTGMNRQGVGPEDLTSFLTTLRQSERIRLDGVMTHLYAADESDGRITHKQMAKVTEFLERITNEGHRPNWLHVGNSAALLADEVRVDLLALCSRFDMKPMMRPGLALYGWAPEFSPDEPAKVAALRGSLKPVLSWKTQVVSLRDIDAGETVGYNGTFIATEPMKLALLAVGYGDGLKRALSNRGAVLVRGQRAPIVGRISMDQTVVDVTDISGVSHGDEVILLGQQGEERITANDYAEWARTVSWEIFTSITSRVERIAV